MVFNSFRNLLENDKYYSDIDLTDRETFCFQLESYLDFLIKHVYVLDPEELGLFWQKQPILTLPSFLF